jgi:RNA polymerase sigma-70 factor (ECF subfamily)
MRQAASPLAEDDLVLVARVVASDDRKAFAALVGRHQGPIRALLRQLAAGDAAYADDLAQATLLKAYLTLDQFLGQAQLRTWLYRIACNEFFQDRRRTARERAMRSDTDGGLESLAELVETRNDLVLDLQRALERLPAAEQHAILLCHYAEMSHAEAAALVGCPLGTLKSNVLRGRAKLRLMLTAWAPQNLEN